MQTGGIGGAHTRPVVHALVGGALD